MRKTIREAINKLVKMKWITLNENINEEAIIIVIENFIKEMTFVDFIRWFKSF